MRFWWTEATPRSNEGHSNEIKRNGQSPDCLMPASTQQSVATSMCARAICAPSLAKLAAIGPPKPPAQHQSDFAFKR
jgi:hypothetical protein